MKNNEELQKDVQNAIKWEPLLNAAEIGVSVKNGIVSLSGTVDSYSKKIEAEDAAKSVAGVRAVVENINIQFENGGKTSDEEIAKETISALIWNWQVPDDKIQVKVENGWVTLTGELKWNTEKDAAKRSVHHLIGVKGVSNNITIKSETTDDIEKKDIEHALMRNWSIENEDIEVDVTGNKVTLTGTVRSLYERDEAGRIAWNAPGVLVVDNELAVEYAD